jgi:hypothetical protein
VPHAAGGGLGDQVANLLSRRHRKVLRGHEDLPAEIGSGSRRVTPRTYGTLTGVLQSGETINANFSRDTDGGEITGQITLVPEPSTALLIGFGRAALAVR